MASDLSAPAEARSTRPEAGRLGYQPGLDGVRAVAIAAVMVFHASFQVDGLRNWGSWLGVDVFFVLSGFLITTLLLREAGTRGNVSLRNFYARRALRLYPLIVVCVILAVVVMVAPGIGEPQRPTWLGVASIAGYFSNWLIVLRTPPHDLGMFSHLWSLAIEEQFYVVWPLLLVTTLRLGGRRIATALVSAAVLGVVVGLRYKVWADAVVFHKAHLWEFDRRGLNDLRAWNTIYYGSLTHSDGLLVGCLLAAVLGLRPTRPRRAVRVVVGIAAIGAVVLDLYIARRVRQVYYPAFLTTWGQLTFNLGVAAVIAHVLFSPAAPLPRVLATRPLVWIGRRSYGLYVLHALVYESLATTGRRSAAWTAAGTVAAFVLAGLSYRYYEAPILRLKSRFAAA